MGGVRTATSREYLFAKKHGGTFILRIEEDTDQTRFVEGAEDYIREALDWCGIAPDEGVKAGREFEALQAVRAEHPLSRRNSTLARKRCRIQGLRCNGGYGRQAFGS